MIVHMVGNAHIDPVWLWGWQAGSDEAVATFRAAADICDAYPEFVFTRGDAWLYEQVQQIAPDLHERVLELVARGQWRLIGGQYVQPDCNLVTEYGWRRQFGRGVAYFEDTFGIRPTIVNNVDSFGHPATLPGLLCEFGFRGYVFHRPRPEQVELPAQTFRWRGSGGGEVVAFRILPGYNARTIDLESRVETAVAAADARHGHAMCFYGVGNHGGGPTRESVEWILEHRHAYPGVELRFSTPDAFFDAIEPFRDDLPVVDFELQQTFPGCYSVMHEIKQRQQRGEHELHRAERVLETFGASSDREALGQKVAAAWDDLLFTSFHDILAGSSIPSAWEPVRAMQGRAAISGQEVVQTATRRFARSQLPAFDLQQIVAINADDEAWEGVVEAEPSLYFDRWRDRWLSSADGARIAHQLVQPEAHLITNRVIFPLRIPARAAVQVLIQDEVQPPAMTDPAELRASASELSNGIVHVSLSVSGISQITVRGRELLAGDGVGLCLRDDGSDTWGQLRLNEHLVAYEGAVRDRLAGSSWIVEEQGPVRARVRLDGTIGRSTVRFTLSLVAGDPRLHLMLEVGFNEQLTALQMPIQLAGPLTGWLDGQAAGSIARRQQPAERPVLGWSRVSIAGLDAALVTNDAWSVSLDRDCWCWTLVRSPKMAWYGPGQPEVYSGRDTYTDQGTHMFSFTLHTGDTLDAPLLAIAARQSAQPPVVFDRYEGMGVRTPSQTWLGTGTGLTP